MPSQAIVIERMLKRVDNAIHNPSVDYKGVRDALDDLKAYNIRPYRDEYDKWILLAIEAQDRRKLCCLFGSMKKSPLIHILERGYVYIPMFVNSTLFNPKSEWNSHDIMEFTDNEPINYEQKLTLFFQQPRSWPVLESLSWQGYYRKYFKVNPVAKRRKYLTKVIMRFWLLTTKPLLRSWRESLYIPGTGALYMKAAASFHADH